MGRDSGVTRDTLLDFFDDRIGSDAVFLQYDDGYRAYTYRYDDVRAAAQRCAARLRTAGITPADKIVVWGENRPEWVVALWGCLLARAVVVPIDYRASPDLVTRIIDIVDARVIMVGREVSRLALGEQIDSWPLTDLLLPQRGERTTSNSGDTERPSAAAAPSAEAVTDHLAEIIFTSGATAEPKGVTLTHRNILANIVPVEREILKYRAYSRPFFPLRFLNLLPLSHMFGQAMATFIPPMLGGITVFMHGLTPSDIVRQIQTRRISVLVCVPKMLEVLRDYIVAVAPETRADPPVHEHVARRWWRYRRVHRMFGFKFWSFVVGAAPLDPELESFWSRLGFLVIQGYGLTETAPIVTLNHPFRARRGSVGTPIGGVDIKIAADGEILVRGANVTGGYYNAPQETAAAFDDGWFRTGDIGSVDDSGRLSVRGRKKEMIVTPEGLNVFPEDVERALLDVAGVLEAAIIGAIVKGKERVHAVLVLAKGEDAKSAIRAANTALEDHQRIRGYSVWTDGGLPRTDGTQKLKRRDLQKWVESGNSLHQARPADVKSVLRIVQRFATDQEVSRSTIIKNLGLSSIERIELVMALERELSGTLDESAFDDGATVADLQTVFEDGPPTRAESPPRQSETAIESGTEVPPAVVADFPTWNQSRLARLVRRAGLATVLLPLTRLFASITVRGLDRLRATADPVVYAANHQSHMDGPVILAAMPASRRYNVATAAAKEFFRAHFHPSAHTWSERFTSGVNYYLSSLFFNVFPLPQREAGTRDAIRYLGHLLGQGRSILIFPEGRRTDDGSIGSFQPGIGMIGSRLRVAIVPVRIEGVDRILHQSWRMARPGRARVVFGEALYLEGENYRDLAKRVEDAVRGL